MRQRHGRRFPWVSLLTVFGLQGVLMWTVSLPGQVGIFAVDSFVLPAAIGVRFSAAGILFEALGHYQVARLKGQSGQ